MSGALLGVAALSGLAAIASDRGRRRPAFYLLKPLTTLLLIAVALRGAADPGCNGEGLLILGLFLCLVGDIALLGSGSRAFIAGLCAFLLGHLAFVGGFYAGVLSYNWPPLLILIPLWAIGAGALVLPHAGRLRLPVIVYGVVLSLMLLAAAQRFAFAPLPPQLMALAGAVLFALSDTLLGIRRFRRPSLDLQPAVLSTYWLAIGLIAASIPAEAAQRPPVNPESDPVVQHPDLDELSGIVPARHFNGYWGHNDGADPRLFRIGPRGEDLGTVRIEGLKTRDWEDLAAFEDGGVRLLLIADVGDNFARRDEIRLHAVVEPDAQATRAATRWTLTLTLPDGATDIEAVAVDPRERQILLLAKREAQPSLFATPLPSATSRAEAVRLTRVKTIPPPTNADLELDPIYGHFASWPSAMDIRADGSALLVVNAKAGLQWPRGEQEGWAEALARAPQQIPIPRLVQTEAGAYLDAGHIVVGSEQRPAVIAVRPIPAP